MSSCCEGLPEVFKWRDIVQSGGVALSFNALLLTMMYNNLGLVYVFTNFLLVSTIITIVYLAVLKFIFKAEQPQEDTQYVYVSEETVQGLIITFVNWKNCLTNYFKQIHQSIIEQAKIIGGIYLAAQVLGYFSIVTLIWLAVNSLLAYGYVAFKLNLDVCGLVKSYFDKLLTYSNVLFDLIPKYTPPASN